jgi:hypothetical protein
VVSKEVAEFSSFMANAERKLAEHTEWKNTFTSPGCQHITQTVGTKDLLPWSDFPPLITGGKFVKRRWFRRADFKPAKKKT